MCLVLTPCGAASSHSCPPAEASVSHAQVHSSFQTYSHAVAASGRGDISRLCREAHYAMTLTAVLLLWISAFWEGVHFQIVRSSKLTPWWSVLSGRWAWPIWDRYHECPGCVLQLDSAVTCTNKRESGTTDNNWAWIIHCRDFHKSHFLSFNSQIFSYQSFCHLWNHWNACWLFLHIL